MSDNRTPVPTLRLRRGADILRVRAHGPVHKSPAMRVFATSNSGGQLRLAVTASRRVGKAVDRNRARRRIRAAFRQAQLSVGAELDVVANVYRPALCQPWPGLLANARKALSKAC